MTLRRLWAVLNAPSDFKGDPYTGLLNQVGHAAVSAYVFILVCCGWFAVAGEMPPRWAVMWGLVVAYVAAIEWRAQGWRGRDSLIDAGFVAISPLMIAVSAVEVRAEGWVSIIHLRVDVLGIALLSLGAAWLVYGLTRFKG